MLNLKPEQLFDNTGQRRRTACINSVGKMQLMARLTFVGVHSGGVAQRTSLPKELQFVQHQPTPARH